MLKAPFSAVSSVAKCLLSSVDLPVLLPVSGNQKHFGSSLEVLHYAPHLALQWGCGSEHKGRCSCVTWAGSETGEGEIAAFRRVIEREVSAIINLRGVVFVVTFQSPVVTP